MAEVNCRAAARLLSKAIDRPLSAEEKGALERHLAACLYCRNYEIQVKFLHEAAGRFRSEG
jgi:hypothetical protein